MSSEHGSEPMEALSGKPFFSRPAGKIFVIWFVMSVVGVLIGLFAPGKLMPGMLSPDGHAAVLTVVVFTVLAAPVAALVYGIGFYSLIAWRKGSGDTPPPDGPPMRGNGPVTLIWLITSAVLVVVLLVWGLTEFTAEQTAHPDTMRIQVIGQQWLWTFKYPGTGVESRTLELPANRPVEFEVTSEDVTHGFWVPQLGIQVDANPGENTILRTTPNKLGQFVVRCSQLCGLYHSFMYAEGAVVTPHQFANWLHTQGASAETAAAVARVGS